MTTTALEPLSTDAIALEGGITLTQTGASIEGEPSLEEFCIAMQNVYRLANAATWAIGDLLVYGEGRGDYGESYSQAIALTQKSYSSLTKAAHVSRVYPPNDREFASSLSWTHHMIATSVKDSDARRDVLQRCIDQDLSRDDLRSILPKRIEGATEPSTPSTEGDSHDVTCPFCQRSFAL